MQPFCVRRVMIKSLVQNIDKCVSSYKPKQLMAVALFVHLAPTGTNWFYVYIQYSV